MSVCFTIYLDGARLNPQSINSFKITLSMKSLLPIGELRLNDKGGTFIGSLGARMGSIVMAQLTESLTTSDGKEPNSSNVVDSKVKPINLVPLVVCRVIDNNKDGQEYMGGEVILSLAHPWAIFKSFNNHAYPPSTLSNVVQTVIEDKSRGYTIPVGKIDITDDTAGTPRYKCGISDDEFLQQLLLPFLISDANPMYSFIDDLGNYNLRTFENIYKDEATVALVPNQLTWIAISKDYGEANPSVKEIANYDSLTLDIGGASIREMLSSLSPKVYFEDTLSGSIKSGILRKSFKIGKGTNFLPINKTLMDLGPISNGYMYQYRTMEDAVGLMHSSTKTLNELISLQVSSTFCGTNLPIGSSVKLCVLSNTSEKKKSMHWLSGSYVIMDKTYYSEGEMLEAKIITTIAKPIVETLGSDITKTETLYSGY